MTQAAAVTTRETTPAVTTRETTAADIAGEASASGGAPFDSRQRMKYGARWTDDEDKLLVDSLSKFNMSGMKVDTGFKIGYLEKLEKIMLDRFPNCGKKAKPQIQNRVKYLKKQALALNEMVAGNGSGFGWDDVNHKLVCDKGVFNDWCKSHPSAHGLFDKKFSHFHTLVEIYASDQANGNNVALGNAEDQVEADVEGSQHPVTLDDNDDDTFDGATATGDIADNPMGTPSATSGSSKGKRKRSSVGSDFYSSTDKLADNLAKFCEATVQCVSTLTAVFSKEANCNTELAKELQKIQGLSHKERVMACDALSANPLRVALFMNTPDEEKAEFLAELCRFAC